MMVRQEPNVLAILNGTLLGSAKIRCLDKERAITVTP